MYFNIIHIFTQSIPCHHIATNVLYMQIIYQHEYFIKIKSIQYSITQFQSGKKLSC